MAGCDYISVFGVLGDAVVVSSSSNRVEYVNPPAEKLLGWTAADLIGEPLTTIMPERMRAAHQAAFDRYIVTHVPRLMGRPVRVPALCKDGTEVDIELLLSRLTTGSHELIIATLRDLRDRVELEHQIAIKRYMHEAAETAFKLTRMTNVQGALQAVTESLVSGFGAVFARIWLHDSATNLLILKTSEGLSRQVATSSRARIHLDTYPYTVGRVARNKKAVLKNRLRDDLEFDQDWVEREKLEAVIAYPLLLGEELVGVLVAFFRNRINEDVLEVLETLSATLATAIDRTRAEEARDTLLCRMKEAIRHRDDFLSIASHELRTPLTTMRFNLELLTRTAQRGESIPAEMLHEKTERIERQVLRLQGLVDTLLDVSHITQGRLGLVRGDTDLVAILREVITRFCEAIQSARTTIDLRLAEPEIHGSWDAIRLDQVVTNLLGNAIKYSEGHPIEIEAAAVGAFVRLVVRDHGIGISPEDQARIFDRFERAVSRDHYGGLGFGLWISRQIVEAHGGTISVESTLGHGSTFTVELPP